MLLDDEQPGADDTEPGEAQESEAGSTESPIDVRPDDESPPEPTINTSDIPDRVLFKDERIRKMQGTKDREVTRGNRRVRELEAEVRELRERENEPVPFDSGDEGSQSYDEEETTMSDPYEDASGRMVEQVYKKYGKAVSEDALDEIYDQVAAGGGGVLEFSDAVQSRFLSDRYGVMLDEVDKKAKQSRAEDKEAREAGEGLARRTQALAEGEEGPSEGVTVGGKGKASRQETTDKDWENSYNEGETPFEELPYHIRKKYNAAAEAD